MIELALSLLAVPVIWAFAEWPLALLLSLVTAILQDPLRKLTPDQPVVFVTFAGIVFGAACLGALARKIPLTQKVIFSRYRQFNTPFSLLLLLIIVQAFNSLLRFGNPMLPALGLLTYVLPFPAIVFAYQLVLRQGESRIYQFMKWYVFCVGLALTTVYLAFSGYDWPVFGQVGGALIMYDKYIGVIKSYSGIFRASEIAAWHAMACSCFVIILLTLRKISFLSILTSVVIVGILVGIGMLTGRRKTVVEVAAFIAIYSALWLILQKRAAKFGAMLIIAGVIGYGWLVGHLNERDINDRSLSYSVYVDRTSGVFEAIPSRVVELGIAPIMWAYDRFGLFGAGLGVGTQGTQYFGGGGSVAGAAEGGLGKITLELGIPGLFVMLWLTILISIHLWRIMQSASRISPRIARLSYGLFSFLVANGAAFSVATQAYGDLFILLILGWTFGFLLAVPVLLEREARARQPANFEELAPEVRPQTV